MESMHYVGLDVHNKTVAAAHHVLTHTGFAVSIPSLSSSPRIFGAPHSGFSWLIVRINSRTSLGTIGRPGLPRLCQCIIVDFRGLDRACLC